MAYATNPRDEARIWFEEVAPGDAAVVVHGGLLDTVGILRHGAIAEYLKGRGFRLILVDHRGVGRSDRPHDPEAYAMPLRVADARAVLDELEIERAHFIGTSYGARLTFALGSHAPERVRSLIAGGQQPFAIHPAGPLFRMVTTSLARSAEQGSLEPFVRGLEESAGGARVHEELRRIYLEQDPIAVNAASVTMVSEGAIAWELDSWPMPCLIFVGEEDRDFAEQARRAAEEIPGAEFLSLPGLGHMSAHLSHEVVLPAILRTLERA